jgi:hypothetical protein
MIRGRRSRFVVPPERAMTSWILARFEAHPTRPWAPPAHAVALAEALKTRNVEAIPLDPLDAVLHHRDGELVFRHEKEPLPEPVLVLTFLDPFRPESDLPFVEALKVRGVETRNALRGLEVFADPLGPFRALEGADFPVVPAMRIRRPPGVDAALAEFGLPLDARLPLGGGRWGRARFKDKGSLVAAVDRLWREDAYAVVQPANETWGAEAWIPVIGGDALAGDSPLAAEAADALGLDICAVRVRGRGEEGCVADVVPFPAEPEAAPSDEVLEAVADLAGK